MNPCTSGTLVVPGARLHFEERGEGPLLLLVAGGNSDAAVFKRLAAALAAGHRVVTYDPRGNSRSALDGPPAEQRIEEHADDASRLLDHLAGPAGPVDVFGSCSGGLVALELAVRDPDRVRRTVAHEPPALVVLPDARDHLALVDDVCETFRRAGPAPALRTLQALYGGTPAPTLPEAHDNTAFFLAHVVRPATRFVPDLAALAAVAERVALAGGRDSRTHVVHRTAVVLAERLGSQMALFPGGHTGYARHPGAFARRLVEVFAALPGAATEPGTVTEPGTAAGAGGERGPGAVTCAS
ncbi:alpha/beta fold hydrolase [Streptomyces roseolilacinus]|uniref:alpha/beta fold hydrolase n=1 Tax=Streptomyces roseolilacinus TaxID=66904 RepID=UPI0037FF8F58